MYEKLNHYLNEDIKGAKARKNVITILMKIWCGRESKQRSGVEVRSIQERAKALLPLADSPGKTVLHWGMILLAYPFFKDIAAEIGSLSASQQDFSTSQVYRRVKELYGDKRRVEVSASAVLGSMKSWQVILPRKQGVYVLADKRKFFDQQLINWLVEASLGASNREYMQMCEIATLPYLFPFAFDLNTAILDNNIFEISNQGIDKIMVSIKKSR